MLVIFNCVGIRNIEILCNLIQNRMAIILSRKVFLAIGKVYFKSMTQTYYIDEEDGSFSIYFRDSLLFEMINSLTGINIFDSYLLEIDNKLSLML